MDDDEHDAKRTVMGQVSLMCEGLRHIGQVMYSRSAPPAVRTAAALAAMQTGATLTALDELIGG